MLISFSAPEYDPQGSGFVRLEAESAQQMRAGGRRQAKTAALDGGSVLFDMGHTLSDLTWQLRAPASPATVALIDHLCRNYSEIELTHMDQRFQVSINRWNISGQQVVFHVSVLRELV